MQKLDSGKEFNALEKECHVSRADWIQGNTRKKGRESNKIQMLQALVEYGKEFIFYQKVFYMILFAF